MSIPATGFWRVADLAGIDSVRALDDTTAIVDFRTAQPTFPAVFCELPIGYPVLALGGEVKVPTLNGREELHIPSGTQPGARFKLRGKGMPNVSGRGHGDLHVIARVAVPKKLTKEQKHLLEELSKTLRDEKAAGEETEGEKPFFERVKDIFG